MNIRTQVQPEEKTNQPHRALSNRRSLVNWIPKASITAEEALYAPAKIYIYTRVSQAYYLFLKYPSILIWTLFIKPAQLFSIHQWPQTTTHKSPSCQIKSDILDKLRVCSPGTDTTVEESKRKKKKVKTSSQIKNWYQSWQLSQSEGTTKTYRCS